MENMIDTKYFSINDLVEKGMGSKAKIKRMISSGKLPSYKFGRSRLISEIDLVNYIKSCQK